MKFKNSLLALTLLFWSHFVCGATPINIQFIENDLEAAMQKAQAENKLIMVDFWASWCTPCKWMDEHTFSNPELSKYLNNSYVSVRIDVDNFDGITYKNQYEIRFLPTLIIMNPDGIVLKKYEETMAPSKLLRILNDYDENKVLPTYVNSNVVQSITKAEREAEKEVKVAPPYYPSTTGKSQQLLAENKNKIASQLNKPAESNNTIANSATVIQSHTPARTSENTYSSSSTRRVDRPAASDFQAADFGATSTIGLYQFNVTKGPTYGYSIQVGAYRDYQNVLTEVAKFQKAFAEKVLVHISELNGKTCYKVMVGHYLTHEAATKDKLIVKESGIKDAFVKDITTMQANGNLAMVN